MGRGKREEAAGSVVLPGEGGEAGCLPTVLLPPVVAVVVVLLLCGAAAAAASWFSDPVLADFTCGDCSVGKGRAERIDSMVGAMLIDCLLDELDGGSSMEEATSFEVE